MQRSQIDVGLARADSNITTANTDTGALVPLMLPVTVSVAVTVKEPSVLSVTGNVPTPPLKVVLAGRTAAPSVEVKCTVPE